MSPFDFDDVTTANENTEVLPATQDQQTSLINTAGLDQESVNLLNQIILEQDQQKTKDLTALFNLNQTKKTLVRVNKLNELLDTLTNQAITRFTTKPDEISNADLMTGIKVIQDTLERNNKAASGVANTPLIQFNQQNNEVNVGSEAANLGRESRERIKNAVLGLLGNLASSQVIEPIELVDEDQEPNMEPTQDNNDTGDTQ